MAGSTLRQVLAASYVRTTQLPLSVHKKVLSVGPGLCVLPRTATPEVRRIRFPRTPVYKSDRWRGRLLTVVYLIRKGPRDLEDRFEPSNTS